MFLKFGGCYCYVEDIFFPIQIGQKNEDVQMLVFGEGPEDKAQGTS